jgi:hypothetical protein
LKTVFLGWKKIPKYGFIDKTGKQIIPRKYDFAMPFSEGLAPIRISDSILRVRFDNFFELRESLDDVQLVIRCLLVWKRYLCGGNFAFKCGEVKKTSSNKGLLYFVRNDEQKR